MNELKEQFFLFWNALKPFYRFSLIAILLSLMVFYLAKSTPLNEIKVKSPSELSNIHLKTKGFELFDDNTWLKGDKELEILNLRALKGQLERDLLSFESIERATVTLDLPTIYEMDSNEALPKAAVILKLTCPDKALSAMEMQSILYYLTGAVKNLHPQRIALSDSLGRLYCEISDELNLDSMMKLDRLQKNEALKSSIENLLSKILISDAFISVWYENESQKTVVKIVIDEKNYKKNKASLETLLQEIYGDKAVISLLPFNFGKGKTLDLHLNFSNSKVLIIGLSVLSILAWLLIKNFSKKPHTVEMQEPLKEPVLRNISTEKERSESLLDAFSTIDLEKRAAFIESLSFSERSELLIYLSKEGEA